MSDPEFHRDVRELEKVLTSYPKGLIPGARWNYCLLSRNIYLPGRYVIDHIQENWDWIPILTNENISINDRLEIVDLINRMNLSHNIYELSQNISDLQLIKRLIEYEMFNISDSARNHQLTLESLKYLLTFPEFREKITNQSLLEDGRPEVVKWIISDNPLNQLVNWNKIARNPHLDADLIDQVIEKFNQYKINNAFIMTYYERNMSEDQILRLSNSSRFFTKADSYDVANLFHYKNSTPHISDEIFSDHKHAFKGDDDIFTYNNRAKMSEELVDKLMNKKYIKYKDLLNNRSVTGKILSKYINGEYSNIKYKTDDKIASRVISHYVKTKNLVDPNIIDELIDLKGQWYEYFMIATEKELEHIQWRMKKRRGSYLAPIITSLDDLKLLMKLEYLQKISEFIFSYPVTEEMLQLLIDNQVIKEYGRVEKVNMKKLTRDIDYELIINHPDLPWDKDILSRRRYSPSTRFSKTKKAR